MPNPTESPLNSAQKGLIALFRGYQKLLSPLIGQQCRFAPTCSHYAIEAVEVHGAIRGGWLALRRILKCHPYHRGPLLDPVPEKPSQPPTPTGTRDDLSL